MLATGDPIGELETGGVLAGEQRGAGGGADGAGGVGLGEAEAIAGERVEMRRFVIRMTGAAEVAPAEIVDEDEDNASLGRSGRQIGI